jgi:hypothetical protein
MLKVLIGQAFYLIRDYLDVLFQSHGVNIQICPLVTSTMGMSSRMIKPSPAMTGIEASKPADRINIRIALEGEQNIALTTDDTGIFLIFLPIFQPPVERSHFLVRS